MTAPAQPLDVPAGAPPRSAGAVALALAVIASGGLVLFDAAAGLANPGYAQVGPGVFPGIFGSGLLLAGVGLLSDALRRRWRVAWTEPDTGRPAEANKPARNVLLIAAALALNVLLLQPLGFVIASAVLFGCVAAAFGSRRSVRDSVLGLILGAAIHLVFAIGLGLPLPTGSVWEHLPWTR